MRLYTLTKRRFAFVFIVFLLCFLTTVIIGLAGEWLELWFSMVVLYCWKNLAYWTILLSIYFIVGFGLGSAVSLCRLKDISGLCVRILWPCSSVAQAQHYPSLTCPCVPEFHFLSCSIGPQVIYTDDHILELPRSNEPVSIMQRITLERITLWCHLPDIC